MGEPRTATVVLLLIAALLCAQPSAGDTAATGEGVERCCRSAPLWVPAEPQQALAEVQAVMHPAQSCSQLVHRHACKAMGTGGTRPPHALHFASCPFAVQWQDAPIGWGKWFVGAGSSGVCAINATGHAWCFGQQADASGALKAVTTPQPVPSALRWLLLAAGAGGANCGIAYQPGANSSQPQDPWAPQGGDLYCWGQNRAGLFGAEHAAVRSSAAPLRLDPLDGAALLDVDVGPTSACARAMDLSLFCWGQNGVGQLGNGTVSPAGAAVLEPVQVVNPRAPEPGSYWMNFAVGDSFVCGVATWPAACGNDNAAIRCSDYGVYCFVRLFGGEGPAPPAVPCSPCGSAISAVAGCHRCAAAATAAHPKLLYLTVHCCVAAGEQRAGTAWDKWHRHWLLARARAHRHFQHACTHARRVRPDQLELRGCGMLRPPPAGARRQQGGLQRRQAWAARPGACSIAAHVEGAAAPPCVQPASHDSLPLKPFRSQSTAGATLSALPAAGRPWQCQAMCSLGACCHHRRSTRVVCPARAHAEWTTPCKVGMEDAYWPLGAWCKSELPCAAHACCSVLFRGHIQCNGHILDAPSACPRHWEACL